MKIFILLVQQKVALVITKIVSKLQYTGSWLHYAKKEDIGVAYLHYYLYNICSLTR